MVITFVEENGERGQGMCLTKIVHHMMNRQHNRKGGGVQLVILRMTPFQKAQLKEGKPNLQFLEEG